MRIGRGGGNWYDIIIIGLASLIVYPDKALSWIGDRTAKEFNLRHLAYFEVVVISLMLGAIRVVVSLLTSMCGFDD